MRKGVGDIGWNVIADNSATIAVATQDQLEARIGELSDIIEKKCSHRPNTRIDVRGHGGYNRILIGYVEDGSESFDAMRFGRVVLVGR